MRIKARMHSCALEHKCCASLLWESVYSLSSVHKRLWKVPKFRRPSVCITLHILSPPRLGVLAFHVVLQRRTPWQQNNKGPVPLSQDGCLRMNGVGGVLVCQSDKQEKWVKRQYQITCYCMSTLKKKIQTDIFIYVFFFIIINVNFLYNTKECVSTSPGMWAQ